MKVLTIGSDRKLFEEGSAVLARALDYASKMEEYNVIVFSLKKDKFKELHIENLHIHPTNSSSKLLYVFDAVEIGKNLSVDIVSSQDPFESGLAGYKIAKKISASLQLQVHTDFLSPYFKNSLLNRLRVWIAKRIIPKADGVRVVSSVIADSLQKEFPNLKAKIDDLPIFVDIEKIINQPVEKNIKTDFPQFEQTILMASRLTKEKRIDIALQVLKKTLETFPKAGLIIAGEGPEKDNLKRLVNHTGIEKNVIFAGWQEDLVSWYKTADIFLLTSEFEGYGMTLIEAGAAGCPIITTDVGLAKTSLFLDAVNSFICGVGDVCHISKHVAQLLTDSAKWQLLRNNMQASIRETMISKDEYVRKYISLLEKLL